VNGQARAPTVSLNAHLSERASFPRLQPVGEPGARDFPVALHCDHRDAQCLGHFVFLKAAEESQFDHAGSPWIGSRQPREGPVKGEDVLVVRDGTPALDGTQADPLLFTPALGGEPSVLVYANPGGDEWSTSCTRTKQIVSATKELQALHALVLKRTGGVIRGKVPASSRSNPSAPAPLRDRRSGRGRRDVRIILPSNSRFTSDPHLISARRKVVSLQQIPEARCLTRCKERWMIDAATGSLTRRRT
jgi:hypothetical protein